MSITSQHDDSKSFLGFWLYIMTDCVLFASLFATFAVLRGNIAGGPSSAEIFDLPYVLLETLLLLTSSFTCGLAMIALQNKDKQAVIRWLLLTFILGAAFLGLELNEFHKLVIEGHSWRQSAFLSSYFTLVGTHGLHILSGLLWIFVMLFQLKQFGIERSTRRQMRMFSLFWHFLDIVWIFIFSMVYLMGVIKL